MNKKLWPALLLLTVAAMLVGNLFFGGLKGRTNRNVTATDDGPEPNVVPAPTTPIINAPIVANNQTKNSGPASESPVKVLFLDTAQYVSSHAALLRDATGKTRLNTILMPPDLAESTGISDSKSGGFVGAESCAECHREYFDNYAKTTHFRTSTKATEQSILGSFEKGRNMLTTKSPSISFAMELENGKAWQRMVVKDRGEEFGADFPFDIVTGSGKLAQSYLYWKGDHLYQLHASYVSTIDRWVNSPGYLDGTANFARPVLAPCLECHATYLQSIGGTTNQFSRDNIVLGISCERCHGPGRDHNEYHRNHPDEKVAHAILNPESLAYERQLDMCQVCHGGLPTGLKQPAFTYRVGAELSAHYEFAKRRKEGPPALHSNSQLPRLQESKCFQKSKEMRCTDCHDPHQFERGNLELFSGRCMKCHAAEDCGKHQELGATIQKNCIDCHMQFQQAEDIKIAIGSAILKPTMRDHFIRIIPETDTTPSK